MHHPSSLIPYCVHQRYHRYCCLNHVRRFSMSCAHVLPHIVACPLLCPCTLSHMPLHSLTIVLACHLLTHTRPCLRPHTSFHIPLASGEKEGAHSNLGCYVVYIEPPIAASAPPSHFACIVNPSTKVYARPLLFKLGPCSGWEFPDMRLGNAAPLTLPLFSLSLMVTMQRE